MAQSKNHIHIYIRNTSKPESKAAKLIAPNKHYNSFPVSNFTNKSSSALTINPQNINGFLPLNVCEASTESHKKTANFPFKKLRRLQKFKRSSLQFNQSSLNDAVRNSIGDSIANVLRATKSPTIFKATRQSKNKMHKNMSMDLSDKHTMTPVNIEYDGPNKKMNKKTISHISRVILRCKQRSKNMRLSMNKSPSEYKNMLEVDEYVNKAIVRNVKVATYNYDKCLLKQLNYPMDPRTRIERQLFWVPYEYNN